MKFKVQKYPPEDQARGFSPLKLLNPIAPHMTEEINEAILKQTNNCYMLNGQYIKKHI